LWTAIWIFISRTTGFDYATMTISDDVAAECEQTLRNIDAAHSDAGGSLSDVVRMRYNFAAPRGFRAMLALIAAGVEQQPSSRNHDYCWSRRS
jgi:enamine deaminase RidA (YjgF/YER057c/UK114 family)